MNKSDKYYLKAGKLELSMLDDDDDIKQVMQDSSKKDVLNNLEVEHTKRLRHKQKVEAQPKLKISREVYNTLHTMGQFLTRQDETISKEHKLQQIASSIKIEDDFHVASSQKESEGHQYQEQNQARALRDYVLKKQSSTADNICNEAQDLNLLQALEPDETPIFIKSAMDEVEVTEVNQVEIDRTKAEVASCKQDDEIESSKQDIENEILPLEMYKPLVKEDCCKRGVDEEMLEQENIDSILESFFKNKESNASSNTYVKELKKHIDKQIKAIECHR